MALDTNIPMQGVSLDTASPLMALAKQQMDNAQLQGSAIDLQNKKNMLTMQTLSAGAAGGQQSYDAAKQLLQKNGVDVSGWASDYQTGQVQAKALQTALIPPAVMMNAGIQQQRNDIQAAGVNGKNAPAGNAALPQTNAQPVQSTNGPTVPQILAQPLQPTGPQGNAPPPLPSQDEQQGLQQLQQHYQSASPEDQKQAQDVVNGAVKLQGLQGDPQAVQKFLDDPNNMHDQVNIDMRKLWSSDTSPDKQQFWQQNAAHIKTGQAIGIAPQQAAPQASQGFTPSVGSANENPKAKAERIASELAVYNASPAAKQADANAEAAGKAAGALPEKAAASTELFGRIDQNLNAMLQINSKVPQQGLFLSAEDHAALSQRGLLGDNQEAANSYNAFTKVNKAQVLNGIQDLVQSGSIRNSRALIDLVDHVNAIDVNASPASREQQILAVKAELKNLMISAQNINADLNGGQKQAYQPIPMGVSAPSAPTGNGWKYVGPVNK